MTTRMIITKPRFVWTQWIRAQWPQVRISDIDTLPTRAGGKDETRTLHVHVHLGSLTPLDVRVEMTMGNAAVARDPSAAAIRLGSARSDGSGSFGFEAEVPCAALEAPTGYSIRVVPDPSRRIVSLPPVVKSTGMPAVSSFSDHPIQRPLPVCVATAREQGATQQSVSVHSHRSVV